MKINSGPIRPVAPVRNLRKPDAKSAATRPLQADGVLSSTLQTVRKTLAEMPEVDNDRVEEMKKALAEGRFSVCLETLADSMQQFYRG